MRRLPQRIPPDDAGLRCSRLFLLLLICCLVGASEPGIVYHLDAPAPVVEGQVLYAGQGFVLELPPGGVPAEHSLGRWLHETGAVLLGEGLRWDRERGLLFAIGRITLAVLPVQITADQIAADLKQGWVEAWNLSIQLQRAPGVVAHFQAEHARFDRKAIVVRGVRGESGHGGLASIRTPKIVIRLQPPGEELPHRSGVLRHVRDASVSQPVFRLGGVPILWLPRVYRDFTAHYPWSHYDFGLSSRHGAYVRGQLGNGFPLLGGSGFAAVRADYHSLAGWGFGTKARWQQPQFGNGRAVYHYMPKESLYRSGRLFSGGRLVQPGDLMAREDKQLIDVANTAHWGQADVSMRYARLPDPDPGGVADERFRSDYYRDDLRAEPLARQGVDAVWSGALGSLQLTHQSPPHPTRPETTVAYGLRGDLHSLQVLGPLHVRGFIGVADLERDAVEATRLRGHSQVAANHWFGPVLVDIALGADGLGYMDGHDFRWMPRLDARLGLNIDGRYDSGAWHRIRPFVGLEITGPGHGDALPMYDFGDDRDQLEEDRRYVHLGLGTHLWAGERRFRLDVDSRWALREQDRYGLRSDQIGERTASRLVDIAATWIGEPTVWSRFEGEFRYDGIRQTVRRTDMQAVVFGGAGELRFDVLRDLANGRQWEYRPGFSLPTGRYQWSLDLTFKDGGRSLDAWRVELDRQMIDGQLGLCYERLYHDSGTDYDEYFGIRFRLDDVGGL